MEKTQNNYCQTLDCWQLAGQCEQHKSNGNKFFKLLSKDVTDLILKYLRGNYGAAFQTLPEDDKTLITIVRVCRSWCEVWRENPLRGERQCARTRLLQRDLHAEIHLAKKLMRNNPDLRQALQQLAVLRQFINTQGKAIDINDPILTMLFM